jgi:Xaa-Pro dipeptidase
MPWASGPRRRVSRLEALVESRGLDGAAVSGPMEVYYFTGFKTSRLILPTYLFLRRGREPVLLTGATDKDIASQTFGGEIAVYENYNLDERMIAYPGFVAREAERLLKDYFSGVRRIGADWWNLPHSLYLAIKSAALGLEISDISTDILSMRMVKDEDELELIARSCELADRAYSLAKSLVNPGRTEVEVYSEIHKELSRAVGSFQYFAGDFVSGERTLEVGGPPTTRQIRSGETFIFDLWITTRNYWSDTCRTFVVGGRPTPDQSRLHSILLRAMESGMRALRPGRRGGEVYRSVYNVFREAGYERYFPHHAGHGIGLDGQEPPFFIPGSVDELRPGMVVTLEPGLYVPGIGGMRIENNFVVTEDEPRLLTRFPLDL